MKVPALLMFPLMETASFCVLLLKVPLTVKSAKLGVPAVPVVMPSVPSTVVTPETVSERLSVFRVPVVTFKVVAVAAAPKTEVPLPFMVRVV